MPCSERVLFRSALASLCFCNHENISIKYLPFISIQRTHETSYTGSLTNNYYSEAVLPVAVAVNRARVIAVRGGGGTWPATPSASTTSVMYISRFLWVICNYILKAHSEPLGLFLMRLRPKTRSGKQIWSSLRLHSILLSVMGGLYSLALSYKVF